MTKRHFIELADRLKALEPAVKSTVIKAVYREMLADFCLSVNPRFMPRRWFDYIDGKCGPNGGKV